MSVFEAAVTAAYAIGGLLYFYSAIRRSTKPPTEKGWEPFEPGICDELPEHPWCWSKGELGKVYDYWCPKCGGRQETTKDRQPPYCPERGGHFHFKCVQCGYEWAMQTADRLGRSGAHVEPKETFPIPTPRKNPPTN